MFIFFLKIFKNKELLQKIYISNKCCSKDPENVSTRSKNIKLKNCFQNW